MKPRPESAESIFLPTSPRRQRGVSIIAAIFLLLLFAGLAAFMVSLTSTAHITSAQDIQGARTYQAAQAGIEWGLYQLDPDGTSNTLPGCFASTTLNQIPGQSVVVTCTPFPGASTSYTEGDRQLRLYQISSTATAASSGLTIERKVTAHALKCRDPAIVAAPFDC